MQLRLTNHCFCFVGLQVPNKVPFYVLWQLRGFLRDFLHAFGKSVMTLYISI